MLQHEQGYTLRSFQPAEVADYRRLRLEALQNEPGMFGSAYAREAAFTEEQWLERVINPAVACLGLYYYGELIGITGIVTDNEQPGLAHLVASYIRKEHRGRRLSALLYKARLQWAASHHIRRIEVGHRTGNAPATAATLRFGFTWVRTEPGLWPDGTSGNIEYYELIL